MKTMDVIDSLCDCANWFTKEYKNGDVEQDVIDAVVVDFVNYFSAQYMVDLAMCTSDLSSPDKRCRAEIDKGFVYENGLKGMRDKYDEWGIIESVNRNSHMNRCGGNATIENEKALHLIDSFINRYRKCV